MLSRRRSQPFAHSPRIPARAVRRPAADVAIETHVRSKPATRSQRSSLWYALYFPALTRINTGPDTANSAAAARHCQHISDYISLDGEDALVLEVGRSLRYFGGLAHIRQGIVSGLPEPLRDSGFVQAVAPSASASLLMARAGLESAISNPEDLRSRLGCIPVSALAIDRRIRSKLAKCGLLYLRDIWRLPLAELRIRFGRHFSDYIEQCLGVRPEARQRWQPAANYRNHIDADHGLHSVPQIMAACEQLVHQLESFLRKNHLCTDQLVFFMDHAAHHREVITVSVRTAERSARLFLLLLETRLSAMTLAGEVYAITLQVSQFTDFKPAGGLPQKSRPATRPQNSPLLDTLAARLGSESVQRLRLQQDYCPEFATRMVPYLTPLPEEHTAESYSHTITSNHNPCWLLQPPRPLPVRNQQLYYLSPLTLLRGPRRIETRWWQDQGIRRDYYVAANAEGHLLWVYQDLTHSAHVKNRQAAWYLHGFFG
jgi:protein ImuB